MKVSFGTRIKKLESINNSNGYGYATDCMLRSLNNLGYQVSPNDASADVEIWFDQPQHWDFSKGVYKIGYHPWESTKLLPGWPEIMNQCDEIWTPSPLIADWYTRYGGVKVPVYVYQHGIEHIWTPVRREPEHTIKFLHIGTEGSRKGGWETVQAFRKAFPNREDVTLTCKMVNSSWNGIPKLGRVTYINKVYSFSQLRALFYNHDVYTYPSAGEGFGLTPLQALATGMPTITVPAWAPYAHHLDPKLEIGSKLVATRWPKIHPGKMFRPDFDELVDRMRYAADNYEEVRDRACEQALKVHEEYDWDTITRDVFSALEQRLFDKALAEGTPVELNVKIKR